MTDLTQADLTQADLDALAQWDTPTICNGMEILDPAWRMTGYTTKAFTCLRPSQKPMVGYARTATLRASVKPTPEVAALRNDYYQYIDEAGPKPAITVIQDLDDGAARGAFWGEVNTNIHKGLGCLGVITNGSIRDLADSALGFQALAGQVGPSHAWVHITGFGEPVEVHGMMVRPGDIIHADLHGACIVPAEKVKALPATIEAIARREAVIIEAAQSPGFNFASLKAAMADAADIH
ncbi:MAG: RraA family protein [Pseudomonadota bacterium]